MTFPCQSKFIKNPLFRNFFHLCSLYKQSFFPQYVVVTVCLKAGLETSAWTWVRVLKPLNS